MCHLLTSSDTAWITGLTLNGHAANLTTALPEDGNCNAANLTTALPEDGNCNAANLKTALPEDGNCNAANLTTALPEDGNCNAANSKMALHKDDNCNAANLTTSLLEGGNCNAEYCLMGGGGIQPHFCPSPNPDFDVSWGKMCKNGEKSMEKIWKKREKVFVLANC